jgi:DNA-binding CsgD family transcriptional regulator
MEGSATVVLLILNLQLVRTIRAERRRWQRKAELTQEEAFLYNCELYGLSNRETDVLRHILSGSTYRAAAEKLFISENTVDAHLRRIYAKAHVKNKVELVVRFYR